MKNDMTKAGSFLGGWRGVAVLSLALLAISLVVVPGRVQAGSYVEILVVDPSGTGFHDALPFDSIGGNDATTVGDARLRAVQAAAATWANQLESAVPIQITVSFEALGGTPSSAQYAVGESQSSYKDFAGAPRPATWYPSALANKLAGVDLDGGSEPDGSVVFNADVDGDFVLGAGRFYYGLDGAVPPGDVSFFHVALHEIGHALGFESQIDRASGQKYLGLDDIFITQVERLGASPPDLPSMSDAERLAALQSGSELRWVGPAVVAASDLLTAGADGSGRVELYAPPIVNQSTLHHFSATLAPDQLMEPFYGAHGDLTLALAAFEDIGWGAAPQCTTPQAPTPEALAGIYRSGMWVVDTDGSRGFTAGDAVFGFGTPTDIPVVGNWDGQGGTEAGVYRNGTWILDTDGSRSYTAGVDAVFTFGNPGDVPVVGDWNGDGIDEVGIYRVGTWVLDSDGSRSFSAQNDDVFPYGQSSGQPVVGDWNGDGTTQVGTFWDGFWVLDQDGDRSYSAQNDAVFGYGVPGDVPIVGPWDGSSTAVVGIFRSGMWVLDSDGSRSFTVGADAVFGYGVAGDLPVPGSW